jgi:hypothetical protein
LTHERQAGLRCQVVRQTAEDEWFHTHPEGDNESRTLLFYINALRGIVGMKSRIQVYHSSDTAKSRIKAREKKREGGEEAEPF